MPTIIQTVNGKVTGLWGSALRRTPTGKLMALKMGDEVNKGDVILTTQDGIVMLTPEHDAPRAAATPAATDIDRVIAELNQPDALTAPAAGLNGGDGGGLTPGLRVGRISEEVSSTQFTETVDTQRTTFVERTAVPEDKLNATSPALANSSAISATEEGAPVDLGLKQPTGSGAIVITVKDVPAIGTIVKADGTVVTPGTTLQPSDLPGLHYVPPADYNGTAPVGDFSYTVTNGSSTTTGTTTIALSTVNDLPDATAGTATGAEDSTLPISLGGNDSDGSITGVRITSIPAGATVLLADGTTVVTAGQTLTPAQAATLLYQPAPDFNGGGALSFVVIDNDGGVSTPATLQINVTPVNDPPLGQADLATTPEDTALNGNLLANDTDVDGPALSITQYSINGVAHAAGTATALPGIGTLLINSDGSYVFTPAANYNGPVPATTYTVSDGSAASTSTLSINVGAVNDAPVAIDDVASTAINTPVTIDVRANDTDADGDTLTVSNPVLANPAQGTVSLDANGQFLFTPANDLTGPVSITYTVTDPSGAADTATVTINVGNNTPPTGTDSTQALAEDGSHTVLVGDFGFADADSGQTFANVRIDTLPAGSLTLNGSQVAAGQVIPVTEIAAGHLVFTPAADANGAPLTNLSFSVQDSAGAFDTAPNTLSFNVTPVNDAPVATADVVNTPEDSPINFDPRANDTDADGQTLGIVSVSGQPIAVGTPVLLPQGTVSLNADGTLTFTPAPNFNGPVNVPYTVSDGSAQSSSTVTINVAPVNDAPVANDDTVSTPINTPVSIDVRANDSDVDGDPLTPSNPVLANPAQGTASFDSNGQLVYTPAANVTGPVVITYTVTDPSGASTHATVTVNVGANTPPAGADGTHTINEDTAYTLQASDFGFSDADTGQSFAGVRIDTPPAAGTLELNGTPVAAGTFVSAADIAAGHLVFTPALNGNGAAYAGIGFSVQDSAGAFDPAPNTISFNVTPVNDAPVANDDLASTAINNAVLIDVKANDTDPDDTAAQLTVSNPTIDPSKGTVTIDASGQLLFTPATNVSGPVTITYTVTDPSGASANATVTVNVGTNTPPAGADGTHTINEDTAYTLQASDFGFSDADTGQSFAGVRIDTPPAAGTLELNGTPVAAGTFVSAADIAAGHLVFTPALNGNGAAYAGIGFSVQDSAGAFDPAPNTISFNVTPVNDAPVANDDLASTAINNAVLIDVKANDTDPDDTAAQLTVSNPTIDPSKGTVTVDASGQLLFTPATNVSGPVTITYTLTDPSGLSDTATVTVNVGSNTPPTGADSVHTITEDTSYTVSTADFGFADADAGQTLAAVRIDSLPPYGQLQLNGNPVAAGAVISAAEVAAGHLQMVPGPNENGAPYGSFTFSVQDSAGGFSAAPNTLTLYVAPVDDTPVAAADTVATTEDNAVTFDPRLNDTDVEFQTLTITQVAGQPIAVGTPVVLPQGTVSLNADGTLTFTPAPDFNGPVNFPYTVTDGTSTSTANVTVNVAPVNDAPVGLGDTATTAEDTPVSGNVLSNDTDTDAGSTLSVTQFSVNGNTFASGTTATIAGVGSLVIDADGSYTFAPAADYNGTAPVATYTLSDGATTSTATLTINVTAVNDTPVGASDTATTAEDTALTGNVLTNDSDVDTGTTLLVTQFVVGGNTFAAGNSATLNGVGTLLINADGSYTFTPAANYNGAVPVATYTLSDGNTTSTATLTLNVTPVNDAPVANADTVNAIEDQPVTFDPRVNDTDVDGPALTITEIAGQPIAIGSPVTLSQGTVSLNADGTLTFTPAADFNGPVSIPYTVSDGSTPATSTITVNVAATPDAPVITGPLTGSVTEDGTLTSTGTLAVTDADGPAESSFVAQNATPGTYGSFTLTSTGTWTYSLNNAAANVQALAGGTSVDETFSITTADGSTRSVVVTVNGTNDAPVAVADTGTATEDTPLTGSVLTNDSDVDTGSSLAVAQFVVSGTTYSAGQTAALPQGDLTIGANGSYTFTPAANYNGAVPVATYTLSDGTTTSTATLTLAVTAVNDAPVAQNDSATLNEDTVNNGNVTTNDSDADVDTLTVTQFVINGNTYAAGLTATLPQGTLTIAANGDYTFTPAANYNGPVPVATYTLSDGQVATTATLTLSVTPVADAPVANDDTASTAINTAITVDVLNNDIDADGDTLTVSNPVLVNPAQGTVSVDATGHLVFTPANNFSGAAQIQYTVTDPSGLSDTATLTVNVGTNTAPTGADAARTINEDTSYTVQANDFGFADTDAGQTLINVRVDALPAAGTLLLNGSPVVAGQVISVAEINAGHLVFSPAANANGANYASFNFSVQDSAGAFDTAPNTLSFNVTPVNDAAVITPAVANLTETDSVLTTSGTVTITDVDSPTAFVAQNNVAGSNGYGHFSLGTNGAWTYTTDTAHNEFVAGQTYTDALTITSADGTTSTITVNILGTNDAAVISPATVNLTETNAVLSTGGTLTVSDVDSPAAFIAQTNVAGSNGYGHFTFGTNGVWTYTTDTAHNEFAAGTTYTDTLTVTSSDGTSSVITVNIVGTNDAAVIIPAVANITETDAVLTTGGNLPITDVDSPPTFVAQTNVAGSGGYGHFTVGTNGVWTYTTDTVHNEFVAGTTYTDTLTVTSADGTASTITVNIQGTNDAAVITPAAVTLTETNAVLSTGGTLAISDADSPATFAAQTNVAGSNGYGHFTLGSNGAWTYTTDTAHNEFVGSTTYTDTLTVTSADGTTSTITVNILGTNDAAVIIPASVNLTETNAVLNTGGTLAISDVDSPATFIAQTNVAGSAGYGHFTLGTNGAWTYTTDTAHNEFVAGQTYTDTLTVTSADGTTSTITVNILGTNDAAVITPTTVNLTETDAVLSTGGTLAITDVDNPATFVAQNNVVGSNGYGHFTLGTDGTWAYTTDTAHNEFVGGQTYTDALTVTSADGTTSTITVNILGTNDAAVITPSTVNLTETDAVLTTNGTLAVTDADSPATFVAQSNVAGSNGYGQFTLATNGTWTYTANTAHNEFVAGTTYTDTLTVTSADGTTSTITVNILGTNDAAVITPTTVNLVETNAVLSTGGTLAITDVDSPATFVAQSNVTGSNGYGQFTVATNGTWTYTANTAHNEFVAGTTYTDQLTVTSADGTTSTITVNILGTNDAAVITPAVVNLTETNAALSTGGTLTITDVDSPATFVAQSNVAGSNGYGQFTVATNGTWTYTANTAHNEFVAGTTYTDTITVTSADGTTSTITVNILGTNDAAVITPAVVNLTETNAVLTTGGTLAITDVDSPVTFVAQSNVAGSYGSFTLATNGTWTYTANTAHNEFAAGTTYTDTITVTSADGTTSTITVNILGTNDAAVITPAVVNLTETNAVLTTGGTLTITDVDSPVTFVAQSNVDGSNGYGQFTVATNGTWTYTANTAHNEFVAGTTYTDTITVTSADGTTSTITVNILGTNDAAVITPAVVNLTETNAVLTTGGTLAITDVDSPATFVAQSNVAGSNGYGQFTVATNGTWTYTANTVHNEFVAGTTYADTITVTSADGTTSTITINILGTNDAAVITPAVVNLTETNAVLTTGGTLAITDVDSPVTFVAQSNVAGSNGYGSFTLATNGTWTYTANTAHNEFVAGQTYTDALTVTSADGTTSTITVNILGTNDAAVITPAIVNLTETNAVLTTGGTLAITDVDSSVTFVAQSNVAGSNGYGSFTVATNGTWTYTANTAHNEFVAGTTYTDQLAVTSADGTTSTITVNILGTNDAAVITPAIVSLTETNAVLTTSGTLAISDVDSAATFVAQSNVAGSNGYGSFTVATNGTWTYTANTAHNEFVAGTTYTDQLTVTSADGTTSTITVNILGTNDAAVITPAVVNLTETNAALSTGGTLTITDVDSPATFVAQSNVAGSNGYGQFTVATNGTWTYTANTAHNEFVAGTTYTDQLTVTSADGTTSTITVNILGTNDAAVITPAIVNLTETNAALTTSGTLAISDVDSPATFVAQSNVAGSNGYGQFTVATNGTWTYTANTAHNEFVAGTTYTDTITVTSADGTSSTITVNILGTNDAAVITPTTVNLTETNAVLTTGGTLGISDVDSAATFVAQSNVAGSNGYGQFTVATNGTWTYTANTVHNEFAAGTTYTDTITVTSADGTTSTITVNILGTNDAAVITPAVVNLTETNAVLTTGSTLAITDVDSPVTFVAQSNVAGSNGYGSFTLATNGTWTYTANTAHNEFVAGQTYTDALTVTSADGTTSTITVNILGTNDAAVITPAVVNLTETNAVLTTGGTLAITDVDSPVTFVAQSNVTGSNGYGQFTVATNGTWTYTANTAHNEFVAGTTYTDTLTVTSADGTTSTVTVNILGTNDAAVITPAVVNLTETNAALTTGGTLAISDVDSPVSFVAQSNVAGSNGYGQFTVTTNGTWTYTANTAHNEFVAGTTYTDTINVTSADGTTSTITVNILGTNDAAVITPVVVNLTETNAALTTSGALAITDVDSPVTFVAQSNVAGSNGYGQFTLATSGTWTYTANTAHNEFVAGTTYTDAITVTSADGTTSTITVNILGTNDAPVATGSAITGIEDTPLVLTWANFGVTDVDTASSSLSIKVATLPGDGTLQVYNGSSWVNASAGQTITKATVDAGSFRFVPDSNESGSDAYGGSSTGNKQSDYASFTVRPNDGSTDGSAATVRVDITPVTDTPALTIGATPGSGNFTPPASTGLTQQFYDNVATVGSNNAGDIATVETSIEATTATSTTITTGSVDVADVSTDDAYRYTGFIYLAAGSTYTVTGSRDDTLMVKLGGSSVYSVGYNNWGNFTATTFSPTVSGYYSLEIIAYNGDGAGNLDLNISVNGGTARDLSGANFNLYADSASVLASNTVAGSLVVNGDGGYYAVVASGTATEAIALNPVTATLRDTDGSESLAVSISSIPVGATLSDGTNSFTATAATTSTSVTGWNLNTLTLTPPASASGTYAMTVTAIATETGGVTATTIDTISVQVNPAADTPALSLPSALIAVGQGTAAYTVELPVLAALRDTDGSETLTVQVSGLPTGATLNHGTSSSGVWTVASSDLHDLTITLPSGYSSDATNGTTLTITAIATESVGGDTATTSSTVTLFADSTTTSTTSNNASTSGTGSDDYIVGGNSANTLSGGDGNDLIYGRNGNDIINGGNGNDVLFGEAGNDTIVGGAGRDRIVGGAGNDTLTGGTGSGADNMTDVFVWNLADKGTTAAPATDTVTDFDNTTGRGDTLDLRDLLQGETYSMAGTSGSYNGNLDHYLHFTYSGGNTTIQISSAGTFAGSGVVNGSVGANTIDQTIVLQGVDLTSGFTTDTQIINDLLQRGKLLTDGG